MSRPAPDRRLVLAGLGLAAFAPRAIAGAPRPPRSATVRQTVAPGRTLALYLAVPGKARGRRAAVLVVADPAGPDANARAAADEVARLGYVGCTPDLRASRVGGTAAQDATDLAGSAETLADLVAAARWLGRNPPGERVLTGRVAAIGLGAGGSLVEQLARLPGSPIVAAVLVGGAAPPALADTALPILRLPAQDGAAAGLAPAAAFLKEQLR